MKRIIFEGSKDTVHIDNVDVDGTPIFAKKHGILSGMIVKEKAGWILRFSDGYGCSGHHETIYDCMDTASEHGYEFFIE